MEFKSLTNIETSFRQIRLFALVFICLCALVTGFAVWNSYIKKRMTGYMSIRHN